MFKDATIVFDLDGTLVDTAPDLTSALNDVLTRRGHAPVSLEAIRHCVGHGARVMIEHALARAGAQGDVDQMLAEFLVHYEANIARESRPYPGVLAALDRLAAQVTQLDALAASDTLGTDAALLTLMNIERDMTEVESSGRIEALAEPDRTKARDLVRQARDKIAAIRAKRAAGN